MSDHLALLIENHLLRLLLDLPPGQPAELVTVPFSRCGITAVLRVGPTSAIPREARPGTLTDREREVLEGVRVEVERLGRRATGAEVRAALKAAGCKWGGSTLNRTLADLVAAGHLTNPKDGRGYGLPVRPTS